VDFVSEMLFFAGYCCSIMMIVLVSGSCAIPFFFVVFLQVLLIVNRLGFLKKKTEPWLVEKEIQFLLNFGAN